MPKDSIALIGFMATGKTTVGKALKNHLGNDYGFIETDQIIIEKAGKSIPKIFSEDGEAKFRDYEIEACKEASQLPKSIISCGGGIILNKINIETLKVSCHIVLLTATPEVIYCRAMKEGKENRPIINKEDPFKEIVLVLRHREKNYTSSAEIVIETSDKSIESIVEEILMKTKLR